MALSLHFTQDIDAVIVAQSSRHLVVIHGRVVLLNAPKTGQPGGVGNFENARFSVLPGDVVRIALRRIVEQLLEEIPQQTAVRSGIKAVSRLPLRRAGCRGQRILFHLGLGKGGGKWRHWRRHQMDRCRRGRRSGRAVVLNAVVFFRIRLAARIGSSLSAIGRRLGLIVRLGEGLRVKIDVSLSGQSGGRGRSSGRLFRVRRAASLAIAATVRDRRSWAECHRVGLLDQVTQIVEIRRRKERTGRRPRGWRGRPRRIGRRQQMAAAIRPGWRAGRGGILLLLLLMGGRGGQGVRQQLLLMRRMRMGSQRTVGHSSGIRCIAQK